MTDTGQAAHSPGDSFPVKALMAVNLMVLMATLDMSIVNVCLPTLAVELDTSFAAIQWVILSYVLVITCLALSVARLGDMRGKKPIFMAGLLAFTAASLLCGLSPDAGWLIAFRALQGVGASMTQALGLAIVTEISPAHMRGRAIGLVGGTVAVGLSLGPSLGGLLIGLAGWRWIFLINVPLGVLAWVLARRNIPHLPPRQTGQRFDLAGALTSLAALGGYCLGMTLSQTRGFADPLTSGLLGFAAMGVAAFVLIERRVEQPMIDPALFRNPQFSLGLIMGTLLFAVVSSQFVMPFFLQLAQGRSAQEVGLLMMVVPLSMGLVAPKAGALSDRWGPRGITIAGLVVLGAGCLAMSTLTADTPWWGLILRAMPLGLGFGLFQSPNNTAVMGAVPPERLGVASGLLNYSRTFGHATGLPLVGSLFMAHVTEATGLASALDLAQAPPEVVADAVAGTYRFLTFMALFILGLALLDRRMQKGRAAPSRD